MTKKAQGKQPYMPFYCGDWKKDLGVQMLSFHDRHVWFEMLMLMHDAEQRGILRVGGRPLTLEQIAKLIGLDNQTFLQAFEQIKFHRVCSFAEDGAIYSRSMVKRAETSVKRSISGSMGGNPNLLNQNPKQETYPNADIDIDTENATEFELIKELDTPLIRAEVSKFAAKIIRDSNGKRQLHQQTLDNWQNEYRTDPARFLDDLKFSNGLVSCWNLKRRGAAPHQKESTKDTLNRLMAEALKEERNAEN